MNENIEFYSIRHAFNFPNVNISNVQAEFNSFNLKLQKNLYNFIMERRLLNLSYDFRWSNEHKTLQLCS